jgi:hypothetical protein
MTTMAITLFRTPGRLIESFPITLPDGTILDGRLHQSPSRRTGRRILVYDAAGELLYDGDDSYDCGNATNRLDHWLADRIKATGARFCCGRWWAPGEGCMKCGG